MKTGTSSTSNPRPHDDRFLSVNKDGDTMPLVIPNSGTSEPCTQISAIGDVLQRTYCNDGVILLTDNGVDVVTSETIGDQSTCKRETIADGHTER